MEPLEQRTLEPELLAQHLIRVLAEPPRRTHRVRPCVRLEQLTLVATSTSTGTRTRRRVPHRWRREPQAAARVSQLERHAREADLLEFERLSDVEHRPAGERRALEERAPVLQRVAREGARDEREECRAAVRADARRVGGEARARGEREPVGWRVARREQAAEMPEVRVGHAADYVVAVVVRAERLVRHYVRVCRSCTPIHVPLQLPLLMKSKSTVFIIQIHNLINGSNLFYFIFI